MLDKTYIKPDKYGLSVSPLDRPKNNCSPFRAQQKLAAREKILEQKLIKQALADPDFAKLLLDQANIDLERAMGLHTRYINSIYERGKKEIIKKDVRLGSLANLI